MNSKVLKTNELEKLLEKYGGFVQGNRLPSFWLILKVH